MTFCTASDFGRHPKVKHVKKFTCGSETIGHNQFFKPATASDFGSHPEVKHVKKITCGWTDRLD